MECILKNNNSIIHRNMWNKFIQQMLTIPLKRERESERGGGERERE
jgi:hypothetical protein